MDINVERVKSIEEARAASDRIGDSVTVCMMLPDGEQCATPSNLSEFETFVKAALETSLTRECTLRRLYALPD